MQFRLFVANKEFICGLALILIAIFCLHGMIEHHHPDELFVGEEEAALHQEDRRWWLVLALMIITYFFHETRERLLIGFFGVVSRPPRTRFVARFNPLDDALRSGIVHPKFCA